uniref:Uncharacterized protein n=1 Tax=Avena sativa TaxID=4498 RepID=A0ACD5UW30_AVESA
MEHPQFKADMVFDSMKEIRNAIKAYSIKERVKVEKIRNESKRIHAVCKGKCPTGVCTWFLKAAEDNRTEAIVVQEYHEKHRCERVWELRALTASFLTNYFMDEFRDNQKMDIQTFATKIQRKFNMCPNRWKLRRARKEALTRLHGDEAQQFSLLCDYGQELRTRNPGSKFFLTTNQTTVDGVVKEHLDFMSDKQKGLIKAVQTVFPDAEHRFCVRHLYQNFHKKHKGETLKNDLWAIARSTCIPSWERNMKKLEADLFNSYILDEREMPMLSMLENMFYKIMHRIVGKNKEAEKWPGRICPKIKKKLDKFTEWSANIPVMNAGGGIFKVKSSEFEGGYCVDLKARTCDCRRWQLSSIPCHHAIACCREDRIDPESLVHSCYSIETHNKAYAYNLYPLRARCHWEKQDTPIIHPPLFTKVMGRPKKNRRKTPEEVKKNGATKITKAGMKMHCSICGHDSHNKRGHAKYMEQQEINLPLQDDQVLDENGDIDIPDIEKHIYQVPPNPSMDPGHQAHMMVYRMGQEDAANVPLPRSNDPLPEISDFVVAERDAMPAPRVTTAQTRGNLRGRGRGNIFAPTRNKAKITKGTRETSRGRGNYSAPTRKKAKVASESSAAIERGQGGRGNYSTQTRNVAVESSAATSRGGRGRRGYNIGIGSLYHMCFGDDSARSVLPDLNEATHEQEEVPVSQSAPQ